MNNIIVDGTVATGDQVTITLNDVVGMRNTWTTLIGEVGTCSLVFTGNIQ